MSEQWAHRVSMRGLAERMLRSGDLGAAGLSLMREGTLAHKAVQSASAARQDGLSYRAEVSVKLALDVDGLLLEVSGRIDGLIEGGPWPVVEEYKTSFGAPPEGGAGLPVHWAQAEGYAHMLCCLQGHPVVEVRLCYLRADGGIEARASRTLTAAELAARFTALAGGYADLVRRLLRHRALRNETARALAFPYGAFRPGQRAMAAAVYKALLTGSRAFIEAPTGTGKTVAALFPAVKALGEGVCSQAMYATARTTGRLAARDALALMRRGGLVLRCVELTARERICPALPPGARCDPTLCPRAIGFYDRVQGALDEAWDEQHLHEAAVSALAERHCLCPHELSLELCGEADVIVGDMNYAFDPYAHLQRVFDRDARDLALLVDEAHQLIPRARDMYAADLLEKDAVEARRSVSRSHGRKHAAYKAAAALCKLLRGMREGLQDETALRVLPDGLEDALRLALDELRAADAPCGDFMFSLYAFLQVADLFDERFRLLARRRGRAVHLRLWCLDPSAFIAQVTGRLCGCAFFSATMQPASYMVQLLGGGGEDAFLALPSPFPPQNLALRIACVSTRYRDRARTAPQVASLIAAACRGAGNTLAFFPSYQYLREVSAHLQDMDGFALRPQEDGMSQAEREAFLAGFGSDPQSDTIALAVLGGAFAEGIDLPGARLSGVVVVGVGLPQVCLENETLRDYFTGQGLSGFDYAYTYPGMTRVVQAAGRLIRTPADTGFVLLIDDRFPRPPYPGLMPAHWRARPLGAKGGLTPP